MAYLTSASKQALSAAVRAIEQTSSAEVVIALRPGSVPAPVPAGLGAFVFALAGLAFLLFSPVAFSHGAILLDTALCGAAGAACTLRFPRLRRLFTWPPLARRAVQAAALAEFVARDVSATRGRTGLLVYVSQHERRAAVVADLGVRRALGGEAGAAFAEAVAHIEGSARSADGAALARAIGGLAPLLAVALPRADDDVNELEDALCEP